MSASLVGSEMCIRDRFVCLVEHLDSVWVWLRCASALCPCPNTAPRYERFRSVSPPYCFPFDRRVEVLFGNAGVCPGENVKNRRPEPLPIPALDETV
eukprot:8704292-Alexandrium_andersonii.AAC.1